MSYELDQLYEDGLMISRMLRDVKKMIYEYSQTPAKIYKELCMINKIAKLLKREVDKFKFKNIKLSRLEEAQMFEIETIIKISMYAYEEAHENINKSADTFYSKLSSLLIQDPYMMEYRFEVIG